MTPILASHSTKELYGRSRTMASLTYKDPIRVVSEIRWPSAMIALGKYQGLALQLRTRGFVHGNNIPDPIQHIYFKRMDTGSTNGYENQPWGDFSMVQQSFSDISLTYGVQLLDLESHKLRIGATAKRVFGARVGYLTGSADSFGIRPVTAGNTDISELVISNLSTKAVTVRPLVKRKLED